MVLLFNTGVHGLLGEQLSDSEDRGESPHHTNGSNAPRPAHFVIYGTLVGYMLVGMLVSLYVIWYVSCICGILV